jgi:hypothetical protein
MHSILYERPNPPIKRTPTRALRGLRPLNSNR